MNNHNIIDNNFNITNYKTTTIVGTNTNLEKSYLRLTSLPNPDQIRPQYILEKSLDLILNKWKNKEVDYLYMEEQFKSIRQDMTIQNIKNEFTVKVYEQNAKVSLNTKDLDQFNQCQSQLINLYREDIKGNQKEFFAYRIIYSSLVNLKFEIEDISKETFIYKYKNSVEIKNALNIRRALNQKNYLDFFKYYKECPNMGKQLIEPFINRFRVLLLQIYVNTL